MDYETEQHYYIPSGNTKDSDKGSYYNKVSEKTQRNSWFNLQSDEDYSDDAWS